MNINDHVISVEEFWRGWSSTEALIVILLVVITFLLIQLNSGRRKKPAFTEEEWDEAVAAWYEWEFSQPWVSAPGFYPWQPPPYEEVKFRRNALYNLQQMSGLETQEDN